MFEAGFVATLGVAIGVLIALIARVFLGQTLDTPAIAGLAAAPVDAYGVGTSLVTGSGHPTSGFVYKLVAREGDDGELVSVAKKSQDKISIGGRKFALIDTGVTPVPANSGR